MIICKLKDRVTEAFNAFQKQASIEIKRYDWSGFEEQYKRQFEKMAVIGTSALEGEDEKNVNFV